jgi:hypothetical protein
VIAVCLCAPATHAADVNGFMPGQGRGHVAVGYTSESYDRFWRGPEKVPTPGVLGEIETTSSSVWLNWGFTDRLALVVDAAYVDVDSDGTGGFSDAGPQNLSVLLAYRLWQQSSGSRSHSLVVAAGVSTPLESYVANAPVARGDETTDGLLRLAYLFRSGRFYWSQQVGFDIRSDEAPDGVPLVSEFGWKSGRWTWIGWLSQYSADGGTDIGQSGFTFPSNDEDVQRLGAKAIVDVDSGWSAFVGGFTTTDGRNTGDATGWSVGLIHHF